MIFFFYNHIALKFDYQMSCRQPEYNRSVIQLGPDLVQKIKRNPRRIFRKPLEQIQYMIGLK